MFFLWSNSNKSNCSFINNNNVTIPIMGDYLLLLVLFASLVWVSSSATIMGDECDWTGSGLSSSSSPSSPSNRGVTPVYLRCNAGRVTWLYPRGALRVLLRLPGQDRDFRACVKLRADVATKPPAARLFLEGPRSLLPLYAYEDGGGKSSIRCFNSKNGQAAIYVEATVEDSVQKRVAEIQYDLQPLPRGIKGYDPNEECRPCTDEELAHAFCTSDLVTRGIIRGVENDEDHETTRMSIKITKLIRHVAEDDDDYLKEIESNYLNPNGNAMTMTMYDRINEIKLHVAKRCKVSYGVGEFVFMARRKLGDLTLQCAPRLEDWAVLLNRLTEEGKSHCVLKS